MNGSAIVPLRSTGTSHVSGAAVVDEVLRDRDRRARRSRRGSRRGPSVAAEVA